MESNYTAERIYWTNIYLKQEQHLLGFFLSLHYVLFQICKKLREGHERATRKKVLNCKEQFISLTRESIKICITVTIRNYSNYIKFTQVCFSTATGLQNHMKALQNAICIKKNTSQTHMLNLYADRTVLSMGLQIQKQPSQMIT